MITIEKLKIFEKYLGDYDHAKSKHLKVLSYSDYVTINSLIQDIKLAEKGLAAESYKMDIYNRIKQSCNDESVIDYLKIIATKK